MITISSLDATCESSFDDEGALRFWCFDADIQLKIEGWPPIEFKAVPVIQFFRSIVAAIRSLISAGSTDWEVFDTGQTFALKVVENNVHWTTQGNVSGGACSLDMLIGDVLRSWRLVRAELIAAHPMLRERALVDTSGLSH